MTTAIVLSALLAGMAAGILIGVFSRNAKIAVLKEKLLGAERQCEDIKQHTREQISRIQADGEKMKELLERQHDKQMEAVKSEFKSMSEEILKTRSEDLRSANSEELKKLLAPLNEDIKNFRETVRKSTETGIMQHAELAAGLKRMHDETAKISGDAKELALALRGNAKLRGNYGEMLLEKLLQESGLVRGKHFDCQSFIRDDSGNRIVNEQGHRMLPDVIVHYPDGKDLIIDSKISLPDYTDYINAEDEISRASALKRHTGSVAAHYKELAVKKYAEHLSSDKRETVPMVVMFIPVDGAYLAAMEGDPEMWENAYRENVLIVSPVTLLALLRLVEVAWRCDSQMKNYREIANCAELMLERVEMYFESFQDIGKFLDKAKEKYDEAVQRFIRSNGDKRGSVAYQLRRMRQLTGIPAKAAAAAQFESADVLSEIPENETDDSAEQ